MVGRKSNAQKAAEMGKVKPEPKKRGRPAKAVVAGPTPTTEAKAGHNSSQFSDEQKAAALLTGVKRIIDKTAAQKKIGGEIGAIRKELKATGFSAFEITQAVWLRSHDEEDVKHRLELINSTVKFTWPHLSPTPSLFGDEDRTPLVDKAKLEGRTAGRAGEKLEPPYPKNTESETAWIAGWHQGQEDLLAPMKSGPAKAAQEEDRDLRPPHLRAVH